MKTYGYGFTHVGLYRGVLNGRYDMCVKTYFGAFNFNNRVDCGIVASGK